MKVPALSPMRKVNVNLKANGEIIGMGQTDTLEIKKSFHGKLSIIFVTWNKCRLDFPIGAASVGKSLK